MTNEELDEKAQDYRFYRKGRKADEAVTFEEFCKFPEPPRFFEDWIGRGLAFPVHGCPLDARQYLAWNGWSPFRRWIRRWFSI